MCCGAYPMSSDFPAYTAPSGPPKAKAAFTLKGWHVLAMLVAFFGVIATVNGVMMTLAMRSMPGIETRSSYEASQKFNTLLAAQEAQNALGWQVDLSRVRFEHGEILVHVRDRAGAAQSGLDITVTLAHPADARRDHTVRLTQKGAGDYSAPLPALPPGQWRVELEIKQGDLVRFRSQSRVDVKG